MIKTLRNSILTQRFGSMSAPKTVQQSIPVKKCHNGGIWEHPNHNFSKCWRFSDINYFVSSEPEKEQIFTEYCNIINSLPQEVITKITIDNHHINKDDFGNRLLFKHNNDKLDKYRSEYNRMLLEKADSGNGLVQGKYITVCVNRKNIDEAKAFFNHLDGELVSGFGRLQSLLTPLDNKERLRIFHDFFRSGEETNFVFDEKEIIRQGKSCKDLIAPDSLKFNKSNIEIGNKFARGLFIYGFPNWLPDKLIRELSAFPQNLMLTIDLLPVPKEEGRKVAETILLGIEADIVKVQQRNSEKMVFMDMSIQHETAMREAKEFIKELTDHDQKMIFGLITIVHLADDLEKLNADTESLKTIAQSAGASEIRVLKYQQEDALNTALPYGLRKLDTMRVLQTQSVGVMLPFSSQEVQDDGGIYYGANAVSHNLIICNRNELQNGNGFILGVSGSGKSFSAKQEIASIALASDDDIIIIDPEREYSPLIKALGGEVIRISANSPHNINALDIQKNVVAGENPVIIKSEFILSLCEQLMGKDRLNQREKSIIDRCVREIYKNFMEDKTDKPPLLTDLYNELTKQTERDAKNLALSLEIFTQGSLNVFAKPTNVDMSSRIIVFDILDLGKQLKTMGMLVVLDAIMNRVIKNREANKTTWIYIDEIYLLFANEYSANFLQESWKRFRKYGTNATGITQNVEDCLQSQQARAMLANSEFLLMLNQAPTDRFELAKLLNISNDQCKHITNAEKGAGLMKIGGNLVPFVNSFPKDTDLYKLMTTKPNEG